MMLNKMYHKVKLMVLPLLAAGVMSACSDEYKDLNIGDELTPDGPYIELTLDSNDVGTRALSDTKTPFTEKEREMKTVDIFLYKTGVETPFKVCSFENKEHEDKLRISLSNEEAKELFGISSLETDNGSCKAFAVVNVDDDDYNGISKESATISQLKAIVAHTASFATEFDGFAMFTKDPNGDVISYKAENRKASGDITLKNLAAKIDVFVSFTDNISADSKTWNVATSSGTPTAEVHILNGVTAVKLSGFDKEAITEDDYYSIRSEDEDDYRRSLARLSSEDSYYENGKFSWASSAPYYTYPNSWETNPLEKHRTSLILKVDWVPSDNSTDVLTTYYNVPVALDVNELESNRYYRLKLEINSLGGQHFGEPLELEGEWEVLDWGHALLEADIREIRYVQIAREEFNEKDGNTYTAIMNNAVTTVVPYYTSHAVQIKSVNVTYRKIYRAGEDGTGEPITVEFNNYESKTNYADMIAAYTLTENEYAAGKPGVYIDQVNHNLYIHNPLHPISFNTTTKEFSVAVNDDPRAIFNIEIKIEHIDDPATEDKITIIQYPPIYTKAEMNPGGDKSGSDFFGTKRDRGFAFVNDGTRDFGGINGINEGWLNGLVGGIFGVDDNPNMYVVTVTNLNESNKPMHLGDPRMMHTLQSLETPREKIGRWYQLFEFDLNSNIDLTPSVVDDDNPATWAVQAPWWNEGTTTNPTKYYLRNYYPTNETNNEYYKYMLAPQFRIASSYGRNRERVDRNNARKFCATYQENGYPAGRWRLPTVGELRYMAELSQDKIIPQLFRNDEGYWTNNGLYRVEDGTVNVIDDLTDSWFAQLWNNRVVSGLNNSGYLIGYTRCVYDEWYWVYKDSKGNKIPDNFNNDANLRSIFHWGDKKKNNPQDQPDITTD